MKKVIIGVLIAVMSLIVNDYYAKSFIKIAEEKAAVEAKSQPEEKTNLKHTTSATNSNTKDGIEIYHTLEAEKTQNGETTKKILLEKGVYNGFKTIGIAACERGCMPIAYKYQDEPSNTLGVKVYFSRMGLYLFEYDNNSFISVRPTNYLLGKGVWEKFSFSNFYSLDALKVKTMSKQKIEAFAIEMSKKILAPSNSAPSKGGNGIYHTAVGVKFAGKVYEKLTINYEDGAVKKMIIKQGENGRTDTYVYMPEYSKLIGTDIYSYSRAHLQQYIYVDKPGVLIWTNYKGSGLGSQEWGEYDFYNLFAMDKQVVRGLLTNVSQQEVLDAKVAKWSKIIKASEEVKYASQTKEKITNQRLPKEGLVVNSLKGQTLDAAKAWATKWNWKETITKAYFNDADWYIVRHKKTGVILRREIRGVIVMTRPDGMCSFHHCVFGQQNNGNSYNKVYTSSITPGQIKLHCENAK